MLRCSLHFSTLSISHCIQFQQRWKSHIWKEAHTALPNSSNDIFHWFFLFLFFLYIYKELRRHCLSVTQTHHLKTPLHESRDTVNDGPVILWISSQRSALLVTPTQYLSTISTVGQHSSLFLFLPTSKVSFAPGHKSHGLLMHLSHFI